MEELIDSSISNGCLKMGVVLHGHVDQYFSDRLRYMQHCNLKLSRVSVLAVPIQKFIFTCRYFFASAPISNEGSAMHPIFIGSRLTNVCFSMTL